MHMHKFEKVWLIFGTVALLVFLTVLGVSAFYLGNQPPSCLVTIDPEKVEVTAPFNAPGLHEVTGKDWDYELVFVVSAFSYSPAKVEIPKGSTVKVIATSKDVIHGFEIAGTNVNMMLEPGFVSEYSTRFYNEGENLIICNEYCGVGHHMMSSRIEVVSK
ncbi:cytochrome B5 [Peribacillus butanolivorans]|uniref:cytochrome B5 n=1 Tax=Peribacillus butanolivorans TaxID=421767 RepID=UPI0037C91166